ncbi:MAG: NAD-dependent protein deacylase [Clostridia bacterium]|nr:NAD-dependent protein deacylase [Clostridia bacterium]
MFEELRKAIDECSSIVFFGGAGVSTESGVPDFRSADGLYNQHDERFAMFQPEYVLSHDCMMNHPEVYFTFHREKIDTRHAKPNAAHKYLAALEKAGKLKAVVTQNVDGLHQKAGNTVVYEIHGTVSRLYCLKCGKEYPEDFLFEAPGPVPTCECGGMVRPDVTLFGEALPEKAVRGAIEAISTADMLIIGGTSLKVYPAASYINFFRGKYLVAINKEDLNLTSNASTIVIHENIGEVFAEVARQQGIQL